MARRGKVRQLNCATTITLFVPGQDCRSKFPSSILCVCDFILFYFILFASTPTRHAAILATSMDAEANMRSNRPPPPPPPTVTADLGDVDDGRRQWQRRRVDDSGNDGADRARHKCNQLYASFVPYAP